MAKAKGIRVNQLAKELGIPSKLILDRCKAEGLGEKVPNHMSLMSLGLAETVREWFAGMGGGVATAVEDATEEAAEAASAEADTEEAVEAAPKPRPSRRKKTDSIDQSGDAPAHEPDGAAQAASEAHSQATDAASEAHPVETVVPSPETGVATTNLAPAPEIASTTTTTAPSAPAAAEAPTPAAVAPVTPPPPVVPPKPAAPKPAIFGTRAGPAPLVEGRPTRPTVSINDRLGTVRPATGPAAERRAPAPPVQFTPKPAEIKGPRVVREEAPEVVSTPRRRPMPGQGGQGAGAPAFTQARPQTGGGVRRTGGDDESDEAAKKAAKGKGSSLSTRRRGGIDGRRGEAEEKLKEFSEADLIERSERLQNATSARRNFDSHIRVKDQRVIGPTRRVQRGDTVEIEEPITVRTLAGAMQVKVNDVIRALMNKRVMAGINQALAIEQAQAVAVDFDIELQVRAPKTLEDLLREEIDAEQAQLTNLAPRPPVVTILGHVDHGKTSLLDKIRHANVAAGEAGGITQHTAAWSVTIGEGEEAKTVTFIDTPGHQAFTSMRARGAQVTDIVVLVVSAAEGVQPQTIESINHARAAGVPIVVALNKIDRPDANPDMVLGQLAKEGLNPVDWGGETEVVKTSATTGQGIEDLIEVLHYQAELLDLKADPTARARGTVIEARRDEGLGPVATVLIQDGSLVVGDIVLCGPAYGRVRSILNDRGEHIEEAGPAMPVIVSGLNSVPGAGDTLYAVDELERARAIAAERATSNRQGQLHTQRAVTLSNVFDQIKAETVKVINIIIKGDVQGSVETLAKTVTDHNTEEVKVRVIHSGVGGINESDVELAMATKAKPQDNKVVIIGFHVVPDEAARHLAEQNHIEIRVYQVIYEIFDDLKKALSGMLTPEVREKLHGHAEIRQVFKVSKVGNIAGCMVTDGHILRGSKLRLIRESKIITEDLAIESLKRLKDDVREVKAGFECGIKIAGYDDIKIGDRLEGYVREEFERTL